MRWTGYVADMEDEETILKFSQKTWW